MVQFNAIVTCVLSPVNSRHPHMETWGQVVNRCPKRMHVMSSSRGPCTEFSDAPPLPHSVLNLCREGRGLTPNLRWSLFKVSLYNFLIRIFESPKCDVNPQPNIRGIGPLVGRTSGNRRSVMHVLAVIFSKTYHFFFICQYIFIQVILSGREIYPLLMYPSRFLVF